LLACILAAPFGRQLTISMEQINFHQVSERNETNNSKTICCTLFLPNFKGNVIATKEKSSGPWTSYCTPFRILKRYTIATNVWQLAKKNIPFAGNVSDVLKF